MTREDIFHAINLERARQARLRAEGKFAFTLDQKWIGAEEPLPMSTLRLQHIHKYPILAEEVGEVARAMNDGDDANLKEELVQVAALCCAWLEAL